MFRHASAVGSCRVVARSTPGFIGSSSSSKCSRTKSGFSVVERTSTFASAIRNRSGKIANKASQVRAVHQRQERRRLLRPLPRSSTRAVTYFHEGKEQPALARCDQGAGQARIPRKYVMRKNQFATEAEKTFREFISRPEFPCLGAKAAFNSNSQTLRVFNELGDGGSTDHLAAALSDFTLLVGRDSVEPILLATSDSGGWTESRPTEYATFIAIFEHPR